MTTKCDQALSHVEQLMRDNNTSDNNPRWKTWREQRDAHNNESAKREQWDNCKNHLNCYGNYDWARNRVNNLRNERKTWNNCVEWWDADGGRHNDWCTNDRGQGWWHAGREGAGCRHGQGKGVCARNDEAVKRDLDIGHRPNVPGHPGEFHMYPIPNIQCCQSIIASGNQADKITIDNLTNQCVIEGQPASSSSPAGSPPAGSPPAGSPPAVTPPSDAPLSASNSKWMIVVIISVCLLSLMMMMMSTSSFFMMEDE
jgi:hypothetical protein